MVKLNHFAKPTDDQEWNLYSDGHGNCHTSVICTCGCDDLDAIIEDRDPITCPECGAEYQLTTSTTHYLFRNQRLVSAR